MHRGNVVGSMPTVCGTHWEQKSIVETCELQYLHFLHEKRHLSCFLAEFPTTRTELNAVFDIFDRHRTGEINYREFVEALRPERQVTQSVLYSLP